MALGIPAAVHIENKAGISISLASAMAEGEAKVGLPDPGSAVHHGEGTGKEPTAQHRVEFSDACGNAVRHGLSLSPDYSRE
jgi:hypothetical protein